MDIITKLIGGVALVVFIFLCKVLIKGDKE